MKVVVVGAGIMGAACGRALARRGADVIVIDRGGAASGTSAACEGNLLVSDKLPGPELDLALLAVRRWAESVAELAEECGPRFPSVEFEPKGGLVVACTEDGARSLRSLGERQRRAGVRVEEVDASSARALEPDLTREVVGAAFYPQDAQLQPTVATEALLASARAAGAVVRTHQAVTGVLTHRDGRVAGVRTTQGTVEADLVVNAAGPWAGEVARLLGVDVPVRPRRGMVLVTTRRPLRITHKVYGADYVAATQSGEPALMIAPVVESTASGTVLVGSSREQVGFDARISVDVAARIAARAISLFPSLAAAQLLRAYVGFRPCLPDHLPLIGPDPRRPGLFHVTGHEGAGIGLSIVSADLLTSQVLGETPLLPIDPFALTRPSLAEHLAVPA